MIGRRRWFLGQADDLSLKLGHALKIVIDASESNIRNLINIAKRDRDAPSDLDALDLVFEISVDAFVDLVGDALLDRFWHGTFATCSLDATEDIGNIKRNSRTIFFDDLDPSQALRSFVTGEALLADQALPPASDAMAALDRATVNDSSVRTIAVWAVHDW